MGNRDQIVTPLGRGEWTLRAIVVVAALIGMLAMHGLTTNHDTTMSTGTAAVTTHGPADAMSLPAAMSQSSAMSGPDALSAAKIIPLAVPTALQGRAPHPMGDMTTACVAVLNCLLPLLAAGHTLIRTASPSDASDGVRSPPWTSTAIYRLRPDLAQLSVLRT